MTTLLAVIATILIVPATIGLLLNAGFSGLFFGSPPRGDAAMGLVIPLVINIASIIALTLAALLLSFRPGGFLVAQVALPGWASGAAAVLLTLGASLAAFIALLLWCEPAILAGRADFLRVVAGWLGSIAGPLMLALYLLLYAWLSPSTLAESAALSRAHLVLTVSVGLLALAGYAGGFIAFGTPIARHARESAAKARAAVANSAGFTPMGQSIEDLLNRDMEQMTADTHLSRIIAFLPNTPDTIKLNKSCKQIVVERALRISPAVLDVQLAECMKSRSYADIRAAAEFLTLVNEQTFAAHGEPWSRALAAGIDKCAAEIELRPGWLKERFEGNTDPHGTITTLIAAADRCKRLTPTLHPPIATALQRLADATENLTPDGAARKLQGALTKAGYSPSLPPAQPQRAD